MSTVARTLRVPTKTNRKVVRIALRNKRSVNAQILLWIEQGISKDIDREGASAGENNTKSID